MKKFSVLMILAVSMGLLFQSQCKDKPKETKWIGPEYSRIYYIYGKVVEHKPWDVTVVEYDSYKVECENAFQKKPLGVYYRDGYKVTYEKQSLSFQKKPLKIYYYDAQLRDKLEVGSLVEIRFGFAAFDLLFDDGGIQVFKDEYGAEFHPFMISLLKHYSLSRADVITKKQK